MPPHLSVHCLGVLLPRGERSLSRSRSQISLLEKKNGNAAPPAQNGRARVLYEYYSVVVEGELRSVKVGGIHPLHEMEPPRLFRSVFPVVAKVKVPRDLNWHRVECFLCRSTVRDLYHGRHLQLSLLPLSQTEQEGIARKTAQGFFFKKLAKSFVFFKFEIPALKETK